MRLGKKGMEMTFSTILGAALLVILLLVLIWLITGGFSKLTKSTDCVANEGRCEYALEGCDPVTEYSPTIYTCKETGKPTCCLPITKKASTDATRFSTEERKALADPLTLTLGENPAVISAIKLNEGQPVSAYLKVNEKLPSEALGPVVLYVTEVGNPNYFSFTVFQPGEEKNKADFVSNTVGSGIISYVSGSAKAKQRIKIDFNPSFKDANKKLTLNVAVLDKKALICRDDDVLMSDSKEWAKCLKFDMANAQDGDAIHTYFASDNYDEADELKAVVNDGNYLLAKKSYSMSVSSILSLEGVSTTWVADDTISVKSTDTDYSDLQLRLVDASTFTGTDELADECLAVDGAVSGKHTPYFGKILNIIGTTTDVKGIPLDLNIGGFRIPTATFTQKYLVEEKTLKLINGKAEFKIDKATMKENFYTNGGQDDQLFMGENAWLCVRATKQLNGQPVYAYAISKTPLKVDVLPPKVDNADIKISYPDSIINTPTFATQYPSVSGQKFFYKQYPQVVITCQDSGQSGCNSFDYYVQTGNFIKLNVNSGDAETTLSSYVLTLALNQLLQYFASKSPETTICPYLYSNEFRANSKPTIQIRTVEAGKEQGIICVRVKDKVGNAVLLWKEIYSPAEMIKRVALEAVDETASAATP